MPTVNTETKSLVWNLANTRLQSQRWLEVTKKYRILKSMNNLYKRRIHVETLESLCHGCIYIITYVFWVWVWDEFQYTSNILIACFAHIPTFYGTEAWNMNKSGHFPSIHVTGFLSLLCFFVSFFSVSKNDYEIICLWKNKVKIGLK